MTKAFFVLLKREISSMAGSPIAYIMLVVMSLFTLFVIYGAAVNLEQTSQMNILQLIFRSLPIWFPILIMSPLITMGLFAEEYKTGTIEMLMTAPVTDLDVVLSKFSAAVIFYSALWIPAWIDVIVFQVLTDGAAPIHLAHYILTYVMLILLGMFFGSMGLFLSSLTRSQLLAAFLSVISILVIFFIGLLRYQTTDPFVEDLLGYILIIQHMIIFSEGVVDSRPFIFYLSSTLLFLALTQRVLAVKRLKA
ncbi:MAG: ABC transporter permease [Verrucomicrobiota bacterium]